MPNSLFKALGGQTNGITGNFQQFVSRLNQFRQGFSGNPKEQVQQLLNSGRMTQNQYNQLSQLATQIQNMLNNQ